MAKFSLWCMPKGEMRAALEQTISELAAAHHGPIFEPHLTLLGDVEGEEKKVVETVQAVARTLPSLELRLGSVDASTTYFQCVFVRIMTTSELLSTYLELSKAFFPDQKPGVYMPHMSLFYGHQPSAERVHIAQEVTLPSLSCTASEIVVIESAPDPKEWQTVTELPLGG